LKKEILSDDFKTRKMFWKNIAENFLENFPHGKIFHLTSLVPPSDDDSSDPVFRRLGSTFDCAVIGIVWIVFLKV
jgi:hypothetical protein